MGHINTKIHLFTDLGRFVYFFSSLLPLRNPMSICLKIMLSYLEFRKQGSLRILGLVCVLHFILHNIRLSWLQAFGRTNTEHNSTLKGKVPQYIYRKVSCSETRVCMCVCCGGRNMSYLNHLRRSRGSPTCSISARTFL